MISYLDLDTPKTDSESPIAASPLPLGVSLVPRPRPIGRGGVADLIAEWKHRRRLSRRAAAA